METQTTLLVGHADPQSFNHRLAESYERGVTLAGGQVLRFNLAELQFDPVLRHGFRRPQPLEEDLLRVRSAIEQSKHLAWVFPTYWGSPPAIVRGLFDRLFLPGWAFSYDSKSALPKRLLKGRSGRVITTMDSPAWWYRFVYGRCLHGSFKTASLKFCGISPVRFTTLYEVLKMDEGRREAWCSKVQQLGEFDARRGQAAVNFHRQLSS